MNDELTKRITETQQKIITAVNESGLHPMILQMMLNDVQHQISDALRDAPKEKADDNADV